MSNSIDAAGALALTGVIQGVWIEIFNELVKELRAHSGPEVNEYLRQLEAKAIRRVENAPTDGFPEDVQLMIVETTRKMIEAAFAGARNGG